MGGFWSLLIDIRIWLYGLPFLLRVIYILLIIFVFGGGIYDRLGIFFWEFFLGFFVCLFLLGVWDWGFLDFVEESYI